MTLPVGLATTLDQERILRHLLGGNPIPHWAAACWGLSDLGCLAERDLVTLSEGNFVATDKLLAAVHRGATAAAEVAA